MRLHSKLRSYQLYGGSAPGSSQSGQPTGGAVGAHRADDQPRKFGTPNSGLEDDGVGVHTVVPRCVALSCVAKNGSRCGAMRQLGGISPRPVVARHKPLFDRIFASRENNRNGGSCRFGRERRRARRRSSSPGDEQAPTPLPEAGRIGRAPIGIRSSRSGPRQNRFRRAPGETPRPDGRFHLVTVSSDSRSLALPAAARAATGHATAAPRSMKMGTIASPWRYDAAARHALQSANL